MGDQGINYVLIDYILLLAGEFYVFLTCIEIQLCNVNKNMHTFQINVFIHFLSSSTCFEHNVFIIRKTICTCGLYGMILYIYFYNKTN